MFAESMAEYALLEDDQVRLFPGIVKTLTQLKLAGKQLFVCSSKTHPEIAHNLENLGLLDLFVDFVGPMKWLTTSRPAMKSTFWLSGMV